MYSEWSVLMETEPDVPVVGQETRKVGRKKTPVSDDLVALAMETRLEFEKAEKAFLAATEKRYEAIRVLTEAGVPRFRLAALLGTTRETIRKTLERSSFVEKNVK